MAGETAQLRASAPAGRPNAAPGKAPDGAPGESGNEGAAVTAPVDSLPPAAGPATAWSSWSNLWQIPTIVICLVLIVAAVRTTIGPASANDFEGVLRQVDQLISAAQFETARSLLRDIVEPNLGEASQAERARFHAAVADLLYCSMKAEGVGAEEGYRRITEQYSQSVRLERPLSLVQVERLAITLLNLGDLAGARQKLAELDTAIAGQVAGEAGGIDELKATRNRVFRRLVDATLRRGDAPAEQIAQMIADYRAGAELSAEDEVWSIARQAELRLTDGQAPEAVQMLLVEMRRLESNGQHEAAPNLGELYMLMGRAYFDLGDIERSQTHIDTAMQMLPDSDPAYGEALVLAGRIAMTHGDADTALEKFSIVVRDFVGTPSQLGGLLGHAETSSILGDHEQAQIDYESLREAMARSGPRRDITPLLAAQSLCDRHDSALALGKLELAIDYAALAESCFKTEETPLEVLLRLASSHRQLGDNTLGQSEPAAEHAVGHVTGDEAKPGEIIARANEHYLLAGDYYLRHANSHDAARLDDTQWSTSLWLAADSFDRGGRVDQAIRYFLRYLDSGSIDDPRRAETLFRLGQAYQAQMNYEQAIEFYEQLVADHPRSSFAADAHVPLSRCYLAVDRRPEAEQQLREVLSGARLLTPDADDYRDALIELGTLHYNAGEYGQAIERYTEAMERYPYDPRRLEIMHRLADSYRSSAMALGDRLKEPPPLPPSEQGRINVLRTEQLQRALDLFAMVCDTFDVEPVEGASLAGAGAAEQDMLRRAHLYRADCAFHLGFLEQAIELYDRAARLYSAHAASMYALVQIVNCYNQLNDEERAGAAHRRALVRLKQLPDSAFDSPESLMNRPAWERWLENSPVGATLSSAAKTG